MCKSHTVYDSRDLSKQIVPSKTVMLTIVKHLHRRVVAYLTLNLVLKQVDVVLLLKSRRHAANKPIQFGFVATYTIES